MLMRNDRVCLVERKIGAVVTAPHAQPRATAPPPPSRMRHVILLIETSGSYGRAGATNPVLEQRGEYFKRAVERTGRGCDIYAAAEFDWEQEQELMADWIRQLPKPVGIMACNDERGLQVLDACRRAGAA